jgi:hypothetical protein
LKELRDLPASAENTEASEPADREELGLTTCPMNLEPTATTPHAVPTIADGAPPMTVGAATELIARWWAEPTDEEKETYYELLDMVENDQGLQ